MKQHFHARRVAAILTLGLLVSACGSGGGASPTVALDGADGTAGAIDGESDDASIGDSGGSGGGITTIDATRGNGAPLPEDRFGPSAYDLARARGDRAGRDALAQDAATETEAPANSAVVAAEPPVVPPITIAPPRPTGTEATPARP